jgi:hypothetical protein
VPNPHRRRVVPALALICVAALSAGVATAQDPRASAAQAAAREWLALADRADAKASRDAAGKKFQAAMPVAGWSAALAKARAPLGAVKNRTIFKTDFTRKFQDYLEGEYALIIYLTSFANKAQSQETVTLERESDGKWRVIGYSIR